MKKLNKLVKQLSEKNYPTLRQELIVSGADKSVRLLELAYERQFSDHEALAEMEMSSNAFYALKFRLNHKIQHFLLEQLDVPQMELIRRVSQIPHMMQEYTAEMADSALKKLERDLDAFDLPYEQIKVVKALKRLYLFNKRKHYDYSKKYNDLLTYTANIEELEDRVAEFFLEFGQYLLTRDAFLIEKLQLIKSEINKITAKYPESHRLYTYNAMVNSFCFLFLRKLLPPASGEHTVEEMLNAVEEFSDKYQDDPFYTFIEPVFIFLRFEYYFRLGYIQKCEPLFEALNVQTGFFLAKYSAYMFAPMFLISKIDWRRAHNQLETLHPENEETLPGEFEVQSENTPAVYFYYRFQAISDFYAQKYQEAIRRLMHVRNASDIRKYEFAELELKLFMAFLYCLTNETELAKQQINAARRLNRNLSVGESEAANAFAKLLLVALKPDRQNRDRNIKKHAESFREANQSTMAILEFLNGDEGLLARLLSGSKPSKTS